MDKLQLGRNIRNIRKEKQITLRELALGICSLGKMSNIENGISDLSPQELEKICKKLEITEEELMPRQDRLLYSEIKERVLEIEDSIFLGIYDHAATLIEQLEHNIMEPSFKNHISYLKALLSFKKQKYSLSQSYLREMNIHNPNNEMELALQSKSHNLSGIIHFNTGNMSSAVKELQKAKDLARQKIEKSKYAFNLAILYASKGHISDSKVILNGIKENTIVHDTKFLYLYTLLDVINGDFEKSINQLMDIKSHLYNNNDYDTLLKSLLLINYIREHHEIILKHNVNTIEAFMRSIIDKALEFSNEKDLVVHLIHSLMNLALRNLDFEQVNSLEPYLDLIIERYPNLPTISYAYYLKAKVLELIQPDKQQQQAYLLKSIEQFKDESNSIYKGIIYYELAKLSEPSHKSYYQLASENFYEGYLYKMFNNIQLIHLMPQFYL
jgi:transcriptional regulator with XRE-family HTH domain